jgi:hypothetical protein
MTSPMSGVIGGLRLLVSLKRRETGTLRGRRTAASASPPHQRSSRRTARL